MSKFYAVRPALARAMVAVASCWPGAASAATAAVLPPLVKLNIDMAANAALAQQVQQALVRLQGRAASRLCHTLADDAPTLVPAPLCGAVAAEPGRAYSLVAMLRDGVLVHHVASHAAAFEQPWPLGSISKAVVALPLLAGAGASAADRWCEESIPGIRNANGATGTVLCQGTGGRWITAEQALAKSNNLATIWALRRIGTSRLQSELARANLHVPPDAPAALAAALGMVAISPRQALECFDALASGSAQRASVARGARALPSAHARWCVGAHATAQGREFVARLLAAPGGPGGTAAFLQPLMQQAGATLLAAKTGTPTNDDTQTTGKALIFTFSQGSARFTVLIALAAPKPAWPLATSLGAAEFGELVQLVLRTAKFTHPPNQQTP